MLDFMQISTKTTRSGVEVLPKFVIKKSKDLMIRGGDFYAIWDEDRKTWSTDEEDALRLIDRELTDFYDKNKDKFDGTLHVQYMWDADTGMIDKWHKYCQKQCRDSYQTLDETLIFSNTEVKKEDYSSKKLPYPLESGSIEAWDKLISTLYSETERHKIEWAIGSIVTGDSKTIQKFMVMYGAHGTGKSTILNIIQQLFEGYYCVFDAKALGSGSNSFALEPFKTNPLVAIQHDGDLSRIEDNTRLNSLVSHEAMPVNEKFKSVYVNAFKCFLFMGTNSPVKITDGRSGLLRRLIDVNPTGNKVGPREYKRLVNQVQFELGAIAAHCRDVYLEDPNYYDNYMPTGMISASNDFYNYIIDSYHVFKKEDGTTLKVAWEMYKNYCEEAKVPYPFSQRAFKEELKTYFWEYSDSFDVEDGSRVKSYYKGFRTDKIETKVGPKDITEKSKPVDVVPDWLKFDCIESIFDKLRSDCPAQYATTDEIPSKAWDKVKTILAALDTSRLHYVKVPEFHIVIDFDLKGPDGEKCLELNIREASKWPATYAELSKSGKGIHLHYIYNGDVSKLSRVYDENIEVKVFTGKSSLRRRLTKCNNLPIATISSGLPLRGDDKMVDWDGIKNEKMLRTMIKKNLNKEYHASTKSSIDYINYLLDQAYNSGLKYDVSDMFNPVFAFGAGSTNQSDYCITLVNKMKFKSEEEAENVKSDGIPLVFYDVEVFPNLFLVNYKFRGKGKPVIRLINPKPSDIEDLVKFNLVGFNNRDYDNHMIYACMIGYNNEQLYNLSQRLINKDRAVSRAAKFGKAYNLSYTDVYDFASAGNKKSLKKWEIELGLHHQELGLPWDQPVPEERWVEVAEYCDNDVISTEAVFDHLDGDWTARQILADLADMTVNDTTNTLTTKIIFGNERRPQSQFNYRDMAEPVYELDEDTYEFLKDACPEMMAAPHGEAQSFLPYFPGYKYEYGKSTYRGEEVGEGGYVYAEPGIHINVALLDIASMHPHSTIAECLFGAKFTRAFKEIVDGRVSIKHEAWDIVNRMLDGKLTKYIQKVLNGELTSKQLADALKTAINSVYGQTFAGYENAFKDPRNIDNIVAKRGALFMVDLKHEVQNRGFTVAHIKTDSIKIPNATPEIIQFVMDFGKRYGYTFEHEATYDRMCLVNDAVYIAKYKDGKNAGKWTATGKQFAVPYVYKTLFSNEPVSFEDMCETFQVKTALYLDMNEQLPDVSHHEKAFEKAEQNYKKGKLSDITFEQTCSELRPLIAEGHDYQFVGRVGQFCPIKPGCGGGVLLRSNNDKYSAATGTKGYRWLESEVLLKQLDETTTIIDENGSELEIHKAALLEGATDIIDRNFYRKLVDDAVDTISKYGDFERFVSDEPYYMEDQLPYFMNVPITDAEEVPFI